MRQAASYADSQAHPNFREPARPEPTTPGFPATAAGHRVCEAGSRNIASGQIPYLRVRRTEETRWRQAVRLARS